jgi:hypothetical protein
MTAQSNVDKLITIFGGSGFLGRQWCRRSRSSATASASRSRRPDLAGHLQPLGCVGQIHAVQANVLHPASVAVRGSDVVINLVGILFESGRQRFDSVPLAALKNDRTMAQLAEQYRLVRLRFRQSHDRRTEQVAFPVAGPMASPWRRAGKRQPLQQFRPSRSSETAK